MSGFYKAEEIHNLAVAAGYEGKWDGTLAGAVDALVDTFSGTDVKVGTVDSEAFIALGGVIRPAAKPGLDVNITVVEDDTIDLLGKVASDLQTDISIDKDGKVTGTLKAVTDYTGFSGDTELQSGHFIALKAEPMVGATETVQVVGGLYGAQQMDSSDWICILRITDVSTQSIRFVASMGGVTDTVNLDISELVLEA